MVKIRIEVGYLESVEDPESSTLFHNLGILGYNDVENVRILKTYEIDFSCDENSAKEMAKAIAENLLINPVINSFRVIVLGE